MSKMDTVKTWNVNLVTFGERCHLAFAYANTVSAVKMLQPAKVILLNRDGMVLRQRKISDFSFKIQ